MTTLDLDQMLRRMNLLHRLALAARSGRPWRPAVGPPSAGPAAGTSSAGPAASLAPHRLPTAPGRSDG